MNALRVALVLRSGGDYDAEDVARLCNALAVHAPSVPVVCLSDVPVPCERIALEHDWPGWWSKMELFRPDVAGDLLYMDLDTMLTGDLAGVLGACNGHAIALRDFYHPTRIGSGLMYLPESVRPLVWDRFTANPASVMRTYSERRVERWGDQAFINDVIARSPLRWQDELPGAVVSYKIDVRPNGTVPPTASIVCFHGKPRPRSLAWKLPGVAAAKPAAARTSWEGKTVFLVGGGPSAGELDLEQLRDRGLVIAINDAARRLPWADVMFTADMSYVLRRQDLIRGFAGTKILAAPAGFSLPAGLGPVERVERMPVGATSEDPMATITGNSGFSALILAAARGASRVVLVGFDMTGPGHWFGEYEWKCRLGVEEYPDWVAQMDAVAEWLRARGCDVVNVNPNSAIRCFRFADLGDMLS